MTSDPRVHARGWARGHNLVHLKKVVFLYLSFLEVHILTTTYEIAFILGPYVRCRVTFDSTSLDHMVHSGTGARGQNLVQFQNIVFLSLKFLESTYLDSHISKNIHTWTICTL